MMLLDPSGKSIGMDAMLPYFQVLPFADVVFRDFTFSGWALLIVNGITNLTAAYTAAADELDKILGVKHSAFRSVRCRQGVFKTIRQN